MKNLKKSLVRFGLAGVLSTAGCAQGTNRTSTVNEYRGNNLNSGDATAIAGLGLWALGVKRGTPQGAQLGQMVYELGAQKSAAEAGKSQFVNEQNVNVYDNTSWGRQPSPNAVLRPREIFIDPRFFACNYWQDLNGDGDVGPSKEEIRGIGKTFQTSETITFMTWFRHVGEDILEAKIYNQDGIKISNHRGKGQNQGDCFMRIIFEPFDLNPGRYTASWYRNGNHMGSNSISVTD